MPPAVAACLLATIALTRIHLASLARHHEEVSTGTVLAGLHYIWTHKIILGAISLDLSPCCSAEQWPCFRFMRARFSLPAPGDSGFSALGSRRGAAIMAILLAYRPLRRRVGKVMLFCVAGFGAVHHRLRHLPQPGLSLVALLFVGATDMVSVVIRGTLVQIATPDSVRGRVNAVDMIFIGTSNEFGEFESGLTAQWFGPVAAVILGGAGTLLVVALWSLDVSRVAECGTASACDPATIPALTAIVAVDQGHKKRPGLNPGVLCVIGANYPMCLSSAFWICSLGT